MDTELLHELQRKMGALELNWQWTAPDLVGSVVLWLTTAEADFLRGRWLSANWRVDQLAACEGEIVDKNLLKLAFNARLGISG